MAIAFRTHHGTYLTADPNWKLVAADRLDVGVWEKYSLERISDTQVALRTSFGTYLTAEGGGGQHVACDRMTVGAWETFGYWIREDGLVSIQAENGQWLRVGSAEEGYPVAFTKDGEPEAYETFTVEEVASHPGTEPGSHPDPVHGRIGVHAGNACFGDDTGARNFCVWHHGDLVARWMYASDWQHAEILRDLDDGAAAGYHIVRAWWHLGVHHAPWNAGSWYPGVDVFETPGYVEKGIELAREVAARGMRIAIGSGGIARMNSQQEREMARVFRRVIDGAGPDLFAWAEGVNEPSSTHATSDNDGDNQPANLAALTRIMTDGTELLFHGGYWTNNSYREDGEHQLQGQRYNYVHGWRGGNVGNKIDRRSTWCRIYTDQSGRRDLRLTIDGESVGWPVSGRPLQHVSATQNGHEMDSHEALGLIAAATALRGIPSHMSGTGVQRFEPFTNTVGWRQIPWVVRAFPRDVARWPIFHGGQFDPQLVIRATTNGAGVLGRVEQAVGDDGTFAAVAYNYQRPDQEQSFEFARTATFRIGDVESMTLSDEQTVHRGQRLTLHMKWGRLLIGRAQ